jgi:hypothetical protein
MTSRRRCRMAIAASVLVATAFSGVVARADGHASTLSVVTVTSAPGGRGPLSPRHVNVVPVHPDLSFKVVLLNGASQRRVKVTLTIAHRPSSFSPIVKTSTIALAAKHTASLEFGKLGQIAFAQRETLKLSVVDSQTHEVWVASYPVIFSLG